MEKLGRFEILDEIGRGGCGVVYRALDPKIGRHVAIKTILPEVSQSVASVTAARTPGGNAGTPRSEAQSLYQRLMLEAQSAGRLTHANIVTIHELDEQDGTTFIVMEFVAGTTLSHLMAAGPIPADTVLRILQQSAEGLDHAHRNGVVHRDIKPANLLVTDQYVVKIADFGIAKVLQGQMGLTKTGTAMGTAYYMSPEQVMAHPVSPQSDQFALAVVAYEMLAGRKPFDGDSWASVLHQILSVDPPAVALFRPGLPEGIMAVLHKALAKQPANRYPTCTDFVRELTAAVFGQTTRTVPLPVPMPPARQTNTPASGQVPVATQTAASGQVPTAAPPARQVSWLIPAGIGVAIAVGLTAFVVARSSRPAEVVQPPASASQPVATVPAVTQPVSEPTPAAEPATKSVPTAAAAKTTAPPVIASSPAAIPAKIEAVAPPDPTPAPVPVAAAPIAQAPAVVPAPKAVAPPEPPKPAAPQVPADERAWAEIANSRNVQALEEFRRAYPGSPRAREALDRSEQIEWDRVRPTNDTKALSDFVARFPAGSHAGDAQALVKNIAAANQARQTRQLVDVALERYRQAFERRSMDELRRVWPTLTRQEQTSFQDFFKNARAVSMTLHVQGEPETSGDAVSVRASRSIQMTSERGREPAQENAVLIRLRRSGQEVTIESIGLSR